MKHSCLPVPILCVLSLFACKTRCPNQSLHSKRKLLKNEARAHPRAAMIHPVDVVKSVIQSLPIEVQVRQGRGMEDHRDREMVGEERRPSMSG